MYNDKLTRDRSKCVSNVIIIYNQIVHRVQQSKKSKSKKQKAESRKKLLHSCQVIYNATKFISR